MWVLGIQVQLLGLVTDTFIDQTILLGLNFVFRCGIPSFFFFFSRMITLTPFLPLTLSREIILHRNIVL